MIQDHPCAATELAEKLSAANKEKEVLRDKLWEVSDRARRAMFLLLKAENTPNAVWISCKHLIDELEEEFIKECACVR
jgi:hypothetical protein